MKRRYSMSFGGECLDDGSGRFRLWAPARRGDVIASDAKRLRFWSRLRRAPTPLRAHSQVPVGRPDSS